MYADDIALLTPITNADCYDAVQSNVDTVVSHLSTKKLQINHTKTKHQLFHRGHTSLRPSTPISINDANIEIVNNHKYLGVHFDSKLDFSKHVRLRAANTKGALVL